LIGCRADGGHWVGELSSSALSTATAVCALSVCRRASRTPRPALAPLIRGGLDWLARHANADGGWGDTPRSLSNVSTTALVWAAHGAVPEADRQHQAVVAGAVRWLRQRAGGCTAAELLPALLRRYGKDRTFSVPILTMLALSGRLGVGAEAWAAVPQLPFELAAFPPGWFAALRFPVVSYALPALIAIGQVRHHHQPTRNPLARAARQCTRERTLQVLTAIQPETGGFLEATPLTSFVVMSLAGSGRSAHPVVERGLRFLEQSARADGSWPIDTNLATWLTTSATNALLGGVPHGVGVEPAPDWSPESRSLIRDWLLAQQYRQRHRYTQAPPGGWAWTDLPGGVPDADDTSSALLALRCLGPLAPGVLDAVTAGLRWLLNLQNRDGGIPTFCRGWTNLPFDRSSPDLTAHAIRAWAAWQADVAPGLRAALCAGLQRALRYLERAQQSDGAWLPLWFGNQHHPEESNPVYGTSRVLLALLAGSVREHPSLERMRFAGQRALWRLQLPDGSWGGDPQGRGSIEETACAIEALAALAADPDVVGLKPGWTAGLARGIEWLVAQVENGTWTEPSPIGFYFAKLWYYERLYPRIFAVAALRRALAICPDREIAGRG
jgi:squalene-hopene/tetraprenyl-beta-curcumene cyclase